jgi:hypothetical protein
MERKKPGIGQSAQLFWKVAAYGIEAKIYEPESPKVTKLSWNLPLKVVVAYVERDEH